MSQNDALRDLANHVSIRTGMKVGRDEVTCPLCVPEQTFRGKFCPSCGHEVTALNYSFLTKGISGGTVTQEEIFARLKGMPAFERGGEIARKALTEKQEHRIIYGLDDDVEG